jgi:hypothetical protein
MIENLDLNRIRVLDKLIQSKNETVADLLEQALVVANITAEYDLETKQQPYNKGPLEKMYDSLKSLENRMLGRVWTEPVISDITMSAMNSIDISTYTTASADIADLLNDSTIYIDLSSTADHK